MKDDTPRNDPPRLDCLTLGDLAALANLLDALHGAGQALREAGYDSTFALWPGAAPKITVAAQVPQGHVARPVPVVTGRDPEETAMPVFRAGGVIFTPNAIGVLQNPAAVDAGHPMAQPLPVPAPVAEAAPAEPPVAVVDEAPPAAEPEPQRKNGLPEPGTPPAPAWTEAEEAQAIRLRRDGHSLPAIAKALGRPVEGLKFRFRNKLADWATRALPEEAPVDDSAPAPDCRQPDLVAEDKAERAEAGPSHAEIVARARAENAVPVLRLIDRDMPRGDAELDLEIAEALLGGAEFTEVATDLGIDTESVRTHWLSLRKPLMEPGAKALTLAAQENLLTILRHRVKVARQA